MIKKELKRLDKLMRYYMARATRKRSRLGKRSARKTKHRGSRRTRKTASKRRRSHRKNHGGSAPTPQLRCPICGENHPISFHTAPNNGPTIQRQMTGLDDISPISMASDASPHEISLGSDSGFELSQ